jgi:hypothetical protein
MKTFIFIQTQFEAIHRWSNAPDEVSFLRNPHRHVFHVRMRFNSTYDREIEFILMKRNLLDYVTKAFHLKDLGEMSCEKICECLKIAYPTSCYISVSEDGENGAELIDVAIS